MSLRNAPVRSRLAAGSPAAGLAWVLAFPWFVHAAVVLLSAIGLHPLGTRSSASAILAGGILCAALVSRRVRGRARHDAEPTLEPLTASVRAVSAGLGIAGLFAFTASFVAAWAFPIVGYDALGYRLPAIAGWLDAGRVAWVVTDDPVRNGYPLGQEAVSAVVAAATGSLRFAGATSFLYVAGGAFSIWLLAEASGVRRPLARAAGALFALVPMVILNAPSGYVDAAFAGAVVALVCTAALLDEDATDPLIAVLAGMAAAHVLSLKGNGIAVAGVVGLAVLLRVVRRRTPWPGATLAAVVALPGTFWILRNVLHTGNPLWPVEIRVAGHSVFHGVATMDAVMDAAHNTPRALASLGEGARIALTWLQNLGPAHDFDDRRAGLGWAWPVFALPSLAAFSWDAVQRRRRGLPWTNIAFAIGVTAVCFALQPMKWWPRYTIWLWGAGALSMAVGAERLVKAGRERALGLALAVLAVLLVGEGTVAIANANGVSTALVHHGDRSQDFSGVRYARNTASWVDPAFWALEVERAPDVCRGAWKPGTDDANLDGVFAQVVPRPRVHVIFDDGESWAHVREAWRTAGCSTLLLFGGSAVLPAAVSDASVSVVPSVAFDPLFVVRWRASKGEPGQSSSP